MTSTKEDLCRRFRRLLDRIDSENRLSADGESAAFADVCVRIAAGEFNEADRLLANVERANFDRHALQRQRPSTLLMTADWREQLNELAD